ncbi:MAG: PAS domain S-box protein [Chlorobium sp.]|nr:PAS domain S-box protein [Chlorobium sp.]
MAIMHPFFIALVNYSGKKDAGKIFFLRYFHPIILSSPLLQLKEMMRSECRIFYVSFVFFNASTNPMHTDPQRAQLILNIATEVFWEWDLKTGMILLSPRYYELTGLDLCPDASTSCFAEMACLPESHQDFFSRIKSCLDDNEHTAFLSHPLKPENGTSVWIESKARVSKFDNRHRIVRIIGTMENVTGRKLAEEKLRKLNRALLAINSCNHALLHAENETELLREICRTVVETGGYRMAWVGYADHDEAKTVRPAAMAGIEEGYLEQLRITWSDTERGAGPTGRAIRTGNACSIRNTLTDPSFRPWRAEALRQGYASVQSLPLKHNGATFGTLTIYSAIPDAFDDEERRLLTKLADNLAYGITMLRTRKARELAEEELRQSEARYRSLFQNRHIVMLIIDPENGRIVDANPAAVNFYGWQQEKLLEKTIHEINPLSAEELKTEMLRSVEMKCNYFLFRHQLADGSIRDVEVVSGPIAIDGKQLLYSIVNDITERKRVQELLSESNERTQFILTAVNAGLWETQIPSNASVWSSEIWRLYGLEPDSCEPSFDNWLRTIIPEDRAITKQTAMEALSTGAEFNSAWRVRDNDGTVRWLMTKGIPHKDKDGSILRYVGIVIDITDRKQEEENKRRLESNLRKSQRLETIGTLAGGIAHDFNNILTPIIGYAEMGMSSTEEGDAFHDYFTEIMHAAERSRNLVDQILTFSRAQEGSPGIMSVQSVIAEALKLLRPSIPSSILIEQRIDNTCSNIQADPSKIHQVIVNCCINAFQAMEDSGGVMTIELTELIPDDALLLLHPKLQKRTYIRLAITDTGIGMDEATLERVFEPFFSTKPVDKGTGLGLSVVHGIVTGCNGVIAAASTPGKGTAFQVYLPTVDKQSHKIKTETQPVPGNRNILFVDDEPANNRMMNLLLTKLGFNVTVQDSPVEALELFRKKPGHFDLVITDLTMPEMNGINLAIELHKTRPFLPIILMTGYGNDIDQTVLQRSGIVKTLHKPVKFSELTNTINQITSCPVSGTPAE